MFQISDSYFLKNSILGCIKFIQERFVNSGRIAFQCSDANCEGEQIVGKVIYHFVRMKLVAHQNGQINVPMSIMGFEDDVMAQFKAGIKIGNMD